MKLGTLTLAGIAAAAMAISSVSVVSNSLRLRRFGPARTSPSAAAVMVASVDRLEEARA